MKISVLGPIVGTVVVLCLTVAPASAELVFFSTGRSMSVAGHRFEGDSIVLALRGGGEMMLDRRLIAQIAPDEVPYPEPAIEAWGPPRGSRAGRADEVSDSRYDAIINKVSAQHGVDAQLVKAVIQVESAYRHRARSPKGAIGLMQLMPRTANHYGVRNPYDPHANIEAGTRHLGSLLQQFDLPLALAAYNAGGAAVRRFSGIPPYPETRAYVARVLSLLGRTFSRR